MRSHVQQQYSATSTVLFDCVFHGGDTDVVKGDKTDGPVEHACNQSVAFVEVPYDDNNRAAELS